MRSVERSVLEQLSEGALLASVLTELVLGIEAQSEGLLGSILLADPDGRHLSLGAGPSLPADYNRLIRGIPVGPNSGSCGTAAHLRDLVIVEDIAADPLWAGHRTAALQHGLRACWSCPILGDGGRVLGTFAFYYRVPRKPSDAELALVRDASQLARLAIRFWQTQEALREQQRAMATLLGNLPGMAYRCRNDPFWTIEFASGGCREITGYQPDELMNNRVICFEQLIEPEDRAPVRQIVERAVARGQPYELTYRIRTRGGELKWVWERGEAVEGPGGKPAQLEGLVTDITDRKLLEAQVLQAQRLESIGTLAGGIAHDLNNIFAPIIMAGDLIRSRIDNPDCVRLLDTLGASAQRGASLVRQILLFARGMEGRRLSVRPAALFEEIREFLDSTFPKSIRIEITVAGNVAPILGDPTQLYQVLLNLCVNARDAMPAGGRLDLAASTASVSPSGPRPHPDALPGDYVRIDVHDNGTGIADEMKGRIFDPFFTTKEVGRGTGLGLSTARAIVKSHRGFITFESKSGVGTFFSVFLPVAPESTPEAASEPAAEPAPRGRGEHVLVVDDEESVRLIMQTTLETFGFRVTTAGDGAEAVGQLSGSASRVDVAIVDMQMPGMDGAATIAGLREVQPGLPVISASGFATARNNALAEAQGARHFIEKPFSVEALLRTVRAAIADSAGTGEAGR